ncbi:MAG: VOC family protein [Bacteroidetes bacterium]|nr:VOC family protein [Bacteroidota bacterium]MDF1864738.1 VOC family protein [Saprospiraceae bacterium]
MDTKGRSFSNFSRAKEFYAEIFESELHIQEVMGTQMAFFNATDGGVGGAVCHGENYTPSAEGTIPYLNGGTDLAPILSRVETSGGVVVVPKTKISDEVDYFAFFMDTEGNKISFILRINFGLL